MTPPSWRLGQLETFAMFQQSIPNCSRTSGIVNIYANLPKEHSLPAIYEDGMHATNDIWGLNNLDIVHVNSSYALTTTPPLNHFNSDLGTKGDVVGFEYDELANQDQLGPGIPLPASPANLPVGIGDSMSLLTGPEIPPLSSPIFMDFKGWTSNTYVDIDASFDYGHDQCDLSALFDSHLDSKSAFTSTFGGMEAEHFALPPSSKTRQPLQPKWASSNSILVSSLGDNSQYGGVLSTENLTSSPGSFLKVQDTKWKIPLALSLKCSRCLRNFSCKSRYM